MEHSSPGGSLQRPVDLRWRRAAKPKPPPSASAQMSAAIAAAEKAPIHLHGNTFQLINADGNPGTLGHALPQHLSSVRRACRPGWTTSSDFRAVAEKVQQQLVDRRGLLDLRAVTGLADHHRAAALDLLGDLSGPAGRKKFVVSPFDDERRHVMRSYASRARRGRRTVSHRGDEIGPRPRPPKRRARCSTRSAAARSPRRPGSRGS